jgi:hypothetical protein
VSVTATRGSHTSSPRSSVETQARSKPSLSSARNDGAFRVRTVARSRVRRRERRIEHRASSLRVRAQLVRDLGLVDDHATDDQHAVADEVALDASADGKQRDSGLRGRDKLGCDALSYVLDRRAPLTPFGDEQAVGMDVRLDPLPQDAVARLQIERHRVTRRYGTLDDGHLKSDAGLRRVSVPALVLADLSAHIGEYVGDEPAGFVFLGELGGRLRRSNLRGATHWQTTVRKIGLPADSGNQLAADADATTRELIRRMEHSAVRAAIATSTRPTAVIVRSQPR